MQMASVPAQFLLRNISHFSLISCLVLTVQVLGRTIRVNHVENYRMPKEHGDEDEVTMKLRETGCAPQLQPVEPEKSAVTKKVKKGEQNSLVSSFYGSSECA